MVFLARLALGNICSTMASDMECALPERVRGCGRIHVSTDVAPKKVWCACETEIFSHINLQHHITLLRCIRAAKTSDTASAAAAIAMDNTANRNANASPPGNSSKELIDKAKVCV